MVQTKRQKILANLAKEEANLQAAKLVEYSSQSERTKALDRIGRRVRYWKKQVDEMDCGTNETRHQEEQEQQQATAAMNNQNNNPVSLEGLKKKFPHRKHLSMFSRVVFIIWSTSRSTDST